jgi:hypothetical protein
MEATAPVDTLQTTTMWLLWAMIAGAAAVLALYAILERRHTTGSLLRAAIAPVAGVALGTAYGLAMRSTVFDDESRLVMSLAFLGAVPFGMGALLAPRTRMPPSHGPDERVFGQRHRPMGPYAALGGPMRPARQISTMMRQTW